MTADDVIAALRRHRSLPEWAAVREFERIDLLVVGCYRSTKYARVAYEVKISRRDWLRELAKEGKQGPVLAWIDRLYVAAPAGVVRPDELPVGWGLVEVGSRGCRIVVDATLLRPLPTPGSPEWDERRRFNGLVRRAAWLDADVRTLTPLVDEPARTEALDEAARRTGRYTTATRRAIDEESANLRRRRREDKLRPQGWAVVGFMLTVACHDGASVYLAGWSRR